MCSKLLISKLLFLNLDFPRRPLILHTDVWNGVPSGYFFCKNEVKNYIFGTCIYLIISALLKFLFPFLITLYLGWKYLET